MLYYINLGCLGLILHFLFFSFYFYTYLHNSLLVDCFTIIRFNRLKCRAVLESKFENQLTKELQHRKISRMIFSHRSSRCWKRLRWMNPLYTHSPTIAPVSSLYNNHTSDGASLEFNYCSDCNPRLLFDLVWWNVPRTTEYQQLSVHEHFNMWWEMFVYMFANTWFAENRTRDSHSNHHTTWDLRTLKVPTVGYWMSFFLLQK